MKKLSLISAALLVAISMAGCNTNSGGSFKQNAERLEKSTRQTVGGATVVTDYSWDQTSAAQTGEVQKTNGNTDYTIDDFKYDYDASGYYILTRIRTSRTEDDEEIREKLVTTYGEYYGSNMLETKHEEYLLGPDDEETLVLRKTTAWYNGQHREVKEYRNQGEELTLTLHQWNFDYSSSRTGYTFSEKEEGKDEVRKGFRLIDGDQGNYERYFFDGDGEDIVYEKRTNYEVDAADLTIEYTITEYDTENEDSAPVVTNVTDEYVFIEVTITY